MHVCGIKCMYVETLGCMYADFGYMSIKRLGAKYAEFVCIYMGTFGCMYADFGCKSMERLGGCMRLLGAKCVETLGCKYAVVGCKSLERLGACLTVGSYTLHVYPVAWAQGPPGPWPKGSRPQPLAR